MLFNSYIFFIFFAVVLLVSRLLGNWTWRRIFLLLASYSFYAAWNPPFVVLLWISTLVDWYAAKGICTSNAKWRRRSWLALSLSANLGLLTFFKYGGFLTRNFIEVCELMGFEISLSEPSIILPVGISFYTFQTLSYTIDAYRGRLQPASSFLNYALYVTFFPQLVAGPIVRASDFLPQCDSPRKGTSKQLSWGITLLVLGLFAKVVIADGLMAPVTQQVFDTNGGLNPLTAWTGTLAFAIQILCDFSGYSTCAIGVALCLGFELPDNFRSPYAAMGFSDFWQRWHITLSSWLRDYLYIPLGGSRCGAFRTAFNLAATMLLGGLWHGASWMFVIWGGLHGVLLVAEHLIKGSPIAKKRFWTLRLGRAIIAGFTFLMICVTWVFFRARSMVRASQICSAMVGIASDAAVYIVKIPTRARTLVFLCVVITLTIHHVLSNSRLEDVVAKVPRWARSLAIALLLFFVLISMTGQDRAFIYFQF